MDRKTVRQRVLKRLLTGPSVLVPGLLGALTVGLSAVAGPASGLFLFMGISGLALSAMSASYALLFRVDPETRRVMDEFINNRQQDLAQAYQRLHQRLVDGGDKETAGFVQRLEHLSKRIERGRNGEGFAIPLEMTTMVQALHDTCMKSLRSSAQILETMKELTTEQVRSEMASKRDKIDTEVERSIEKLGLALDRMQTSTFRSEDAGDLARVRDELEAGLETARRVDDRIAKIEKELGQRFDTMD